MKTAKKASAKGKEAAKVGKRPAMDSEPKPGKKPVGGPRPGSGRPRKIIDMALVEKLAQIHASQEEIAATLGVSVGYVSEHLKDGADPAFAAAHARGWSNGRLNLRRRQLEKAMGGDSTMLIWLGKNMLGQADKSEVKNHQTFSFVVDLS